MAGEVRRLEHMLEIASDWFWEMDADLRFTYFSPGAFSTLAVDAQTMLGKTRTALFSDDDLKRPEIQAHIRQLEEHLPFSGFVYTAHLPSGQTRTFSVSGQPVFGDDNRFQGYRGATSDVTEAYEVQKTAEEAQARLEAQTTLLKSTLNGLNQAVMAFDCDLRLLICNQPLIDMFDLPTELTQASTPLEAIIRHNLQQGWFDRTNSDIETRLKARLDLYRSGENATEVLKHPNGTILQLSRRFLEDGVLIMTYTDITAHKHQEQQLLEAKETAEFANYTKTQFLANMSHELRTPLNAIIGFSEIIRDELYGPLGRPEYKDFANDIHNSGTHLLSIISDILDLSKLEAGQKELSETEVDVNATVTSCLHYVDQRALKNNLVLQNAIPPGLPHLVADEVILRQIIINLLSNAVKFTLRGTVKVVAEQREDKGIQLRVSDTGIGMSEDEIAIALTPFAQIESHLTRKYEGTGLGLPLVRNLVLLHDAQLTIKSAKDHGTDVIIDFPSSRTLKPRALK